MATREEPSYFSDVRNSTGMRLLRRELPFQKRIDSAQANQAAVTTANRAVAEVNARNAARPQPSITPIASKQGGFSGVVGGRSAAAGSGSAPSPSVASPITAGAGMALEGGAITPTAAPVAAKRPVRSLNLGKSDIYGGGATTKDSLASSIDRNGVPTYDNASIERLAARTGSPASAPSAAASIPVTAAAPAVSPSFASRPVAGGGIGAVIRAEDPEKRLASNLDSMISQLSMSADTRSKREQLSSLLRERAGLVANRSSIDSNEAIAEGNRASEVQRTAMTQDGESQRAALQAQNNLTVEQLRQQGQLEATRVARKPNQPTVSRDGTMGLIGDDGVFTPVKTADGQAVLAPEQREAKSGVSPDAVLKAYSDRQAAIQNMLVAPEGQTIEEAKQAALSELDSSPLGQSYGQLFSANNAGAGSTHNSKPVLRTGTLNGRRVVQYADGTTGFLD